MSMIHLTKFKFGDKVMWKGEDDRVWRKAVILGVKGGKVNRKYHIAYLNPNFKFAMCDVIINELELTKGWDE